VALSLHGGGRPGEESLFLKRQGTMRGSASAVSVTAEVPTAGAQATEVT
jgi:hypothetical protein